MIVFFEDDFTFDNDKKNIFYGLSRISLLMRERLLIELQNVNTVNVEKLREFCGIVDNYVELIDWDDEIPKGDIEVLFQIIGNMHEGKDDSNRLKEFFETFDMSQLQNVEDIVNNYGIGVRIPKYFEQVFEDYIFKGSRWKNFKIYSDFIAKTKDSFLVDLEEGIKLEGSITCIIDNQLKKDQRAAEILTEIERFNQNVRHDIIGAILSSKEKEEKINNKIFAEYVTKENPEGLQIALAKSAYSLLLSKFKNVYLKILEKSFDEAVINKDIAYYFARMASYEGVTNYKVITDWINLFFKYKINLTDEVYDIIKLTQLIDIINEDGIEYSGEMQKLNTFEAFDLNVNKYYQPPAAGDVFKDDRDNYFILVGQDCELMVSQTRSGKSAVSELVKASIVDQVSIEKIENNLKYMYINNFRDNDTEQSKCLEINYATREFLDNAIIKLCNFNNDGVCKINLNKELDVEVQDIIPPYLHDNYKKLQKYFSSIEEIKGVLGGKFQEFIESEFTHRLKYISDYKMDSEKNIIFPYQRIARLNHNYVLYLYKLFLEHRGRHPFDSINLTRHASLMIPIVGKDFTLPIDVILSTNREENRKHYYKKLEWHVNPKELESVIETIGLGKVIIIQKDMLSLKDNVNTIDCEEETKIIINKTKNGAEIKITKANS